MPAIARSIFARRRLTIAMVAGLLFLGPIGTRIDAQEIFELQIDPADPSEVASTDTAAPESVATESETAQPPKDQPATPADDVDSPESDAPELGAGQSDLEEAIVKRIDAETSGQLEATSALLESAITKGLDSENESFAKTMLGSVLMQRAELLVRKIANAPGRKKLDLRDEALEILERAVQNDPKMVEGYLLIARLNLAGGGDKDSIFQATTKAIELLDDQPVDQSAAYVLRALTRDDQPSRMEDLNAAIKIDATNKEALQLRAQLKLQTGNVAGAVEDLEAVLAIDPTNLQVADAAIKTLIKLERTDDAISLIGRSIEAQPNEGMYRLRAVLHQANGDTEKATADLDKAIAMSPSDPRTLLLRATVALDRDDVKAAKADFRAAATIAPQIMAADQGIELRLQIALKENRMADAINDAKLLMDRLPKDPFRRLRLASLYSIDKRPRKAIELLTNLLEEIPENVAALRSRGDAWLSVGDHAKAIADYESAIAAIGKVTLESSTESEIDEAAGLYNNLAWVLATSPKDDVRSGTRSVELAKMSAELTKYEAPHILSTLAAAYAENGDFENARKWSEKAVELAGDEGHNQLQQLQQELNSYKEDKPWREIQEVEENDLPILDPKDLIDT